MSIVNDSFIAPQKDFHILFDTKIALPATSKCIAENIASALETLLNNRVAIGRVAGTQLKGNKAGYGAIWDSGLSENIVGQIPYDGVVKPTIRRARLTGTVGMIRMAKGSIYALRIRSENKEFCRMLNSMTRCWKTGGLFDSLKDIDSDILLELYELTGNVDVTFVYIGKEENAEARELAKQGRMSEQTAVSPQPFAISQRNCVSECRSPCNPEMDGFCDMAGESNFDGYNSDESGSYGFFADRSDFVRDMDL